MPTAPTEYAIRVDAVTKQYGDFTAVRDLSFVVPRGVVYGLLGPNGSGKTTTMRMVNDIIKPDGGAIHILDGLSPGRRAATHIGYLPEERGLYVKMQVAEMLAFFGELRGLTGSVATKRASAWLERLGIGDWAGHKVQDLSKGMQQKVQFACTLLHEPELLILDEPWSGLDPINAQVLRDIVREQREAGRTIVFSTHLMEQAEQICDRVCIIARGERVLEGELAAIKREATGDRLVAVAFDGTETRERAESGPLSDRELVRSMRREKELFEVELADGVSPERLLKALVAADLSIRRFERLEPSLHKIFVDRVGHEGAAPRVPGSEVASA